MLLVEECLMMGQQGTLRLTYAHELGLVRWAIS